MPAAFVPKLRERSKRDEYTAILNPDEPYDDFILQLTENLKGSLTNVWYVDKYTISKPSVRDWQNC